MKHEFDGQGFVIKNGVQEYYRDLDIQRAKQYLFGKDSEKHFHPWRYFWRHILGGVWQ